MIFNRIKEIRESEELTQEKIASLLEVKRSAYSLWELNINTIPLIKLNNFCNTFKINMDYIANLSDKKHCELTYCEIDTKELGKKLKQVRKELKMTQEKLAKILNTTHSAISAYENDVTIIPTLFLVEISKISKISLNWFCGKTENRVIL